MKTKSKIRWISLLILIIVVLSGLVAYFWPENLPQNEGQRLHDEIGPYDVVIIFNPGGWGDVTPAQATDFAPILLEIRQTLASIGYQPVIIPYSRTPSGLSGELTGVKEFLNPFRNTSRVQANDIEYLADSYPQKQFILTGFSSGGGLTARTVKDIANQTHVYSIVAGVPCWYQTYSSANSLVLDNNGQDSLCSCDIKNIALSIIKAPFEWIWGKLTGRNLSIGRAFQFPGHEYNWTSSEVGPPIIQFLKNNFIAKALH